MNYYQRIEHAITYIEDNLTNALPLEKIAAEAFYSSFHFHRVFKAVVGETIGSYVRKRRLSLAALDLLTSKKEILEIAITYCFESQESFTRAFQKQFGTTPAKYRTNNKRLVIFEKKELASRMIQHLNGGINLKTKQILKDQFIVVGMECRATMENNEMIIPKLWERFIPQSHTIKNRIDNTTFYGLSINDPAIKAEEFTYTTEFTYLAAVEVTDDQTIPEGMVKRVIPAHKYAVFTHKGPLSKLDITYNYIYGTWQPQSGHATTGNDFELYDTRFNPQDPDNSEIDIYLPIK